MTNQYRAAISTAITAIKPRKNGMLSRTISPQLVSVGTPKIPCLIVSVMSSCAMWIQYSCGTLIKTQMAKAAPTTAVALRRFGFQRRRTAS